MAQDYTRSYYPVYLDLHGRRSVVVGGGGVGERKVQTLLEYGATVEVISPEVTDLLAQFAEEGVIVWHRRPYVPGDLEGAFLVICATDSNEVNRAVFAEGESRGIMVNIVDVPELCNFIVPSIVRRGPLQIAISTGGAAPLVAKGIRKELQGRYGDEWGAYLKLMAEVRCLVIDRVPGGEPVRKPIFSAIAGSDLFERVASGDVPTAEEVFKRFVPAELVDDPDRCIEEDEADVCNLVAPDVDAGDGQGA